MIGKDDYVDKQIAKAKLGVDALDSLQKQYDKVTENEPEFAAALSAEAQSAKQAELLEKIQGERESLISRVDDLDSELELQVLSSAIGSAARTLDEAGVDIARSHGWRQFRRHGQPCRRQGGYDTGCGARSASGCRVLRCLGDGP